MIAFFSKQKRILGAAVSALQLFVAGVSIWALSLEPWILCEIFVFLGFNKTSFRACKKY